MNIVDCSEAHYQRICDIYNHYIENTVISFEEEKLSADDIKTRVETYTKKFPWLVGLVDDQVVGYAYAAPWQNRCAYRASVELSCYLDHQLRGKGYGKLLYGELITRLKTLDCHAIIAGVALPNAASVKLQEAFGFEKVAHYKEVGYKFNQWIDVGYWQLILPSKHNT